MSLAMVQIFNVRSCILRTVVNYDFSLALNIDSRVAQARNRTLLLRLRALLSMPMAHPKFPNLQPFEVIVTIKATMKSTTVMVLVQSSGVQSVYNC